MADDISKKITIAVELEAGNITENINSLNKSIDELLAKQEQLKNSGKQNSADFSDTADKVEELQKKIKALSTQLSSGSSALKTLGSSAKTAGTALAALATQQQKAAKATSDATAKTKELSKQVSNLDKATAKNKKSTGDSKKAADALGGSLAKSATKAKQLKGAVSGASGALKSQQGTIATNKKAFDGHKKTMDELKKSFKSIENVSGIFGPSLKDAADGFNSMKKGLDIVQGGIKGIGTAIKSDGLGFLLEILQDLFDNFLKSSEGSAILSGAISAIGVVVNKVKDFVNTLKTGIIDAVTHPVESLKTLGKMIMENIVNRFKAFSVILDGIIHLDFKKVANGALQAVTGVTDATGKLAKAYDHAKEIVVQTTGEMITAFDEGEKQAKANAKAINKNGEVIIKSFRRQKAAHTDLVESTKKLNDEQLDSAGQVAEAQKELAELQVKAMKEGKEKQIAELQLQLNNQQAELDKALKDSVDKVKKLSEDILAAKKTDPKADTTELQQQLNLQMQLQTVNNQKRIIMEQQTAEAINKIKQDEVINNDTKAVDNENDPEKKLEAEKKLITDKAAFEISHANNNAAAIVSITQKLNADLLQLNKDYEEKKQKDAAEKRTKFKEEAKKDAKQIFDQSLALLSSSIKQESEAKIAGLEKDKTAELSNKGLTSAQRLAIEQKYRREEGAIKVKAFKEEQEISIAQALINGALAITKVSSQSGVLAPLEIGVTIAETAIQVAKIASQKPPAYAKGGLHYASDGRGGVLPGYSRTDNTNAFLRSGEGIVVSEAMQVPWARNLVSAINVGFGGRDFSITNPGRGYAVGGIFTDGGDANRFYNAPVADQKNLANSIAYQMINNFPPVYVDVKDVNNQQNILAQTINRVNL
eukprot:gene11453-11543_t